MSFDWTASALDTLRRLWAEGFSASEIGRRMGCNKNQVLGKVHRLGLPPRPQPVKGRWDGVTSARSRKAAGVAEHRTRHPEAYPRPETASASPAALPGTTPAAPAPPRTCQFIFGDVRQPGWRFCDAPATHGSWCAHHRAVCFEPAKRREAA